MRIAFIANEKYIPTAVKAVRNLSGASKEYAENLVRLSLPGHVAFVPLAIGLNDKKYVREMRNLIASCHVCVPVEEVLQTVTLEVLNMCLLQVFNRAMRE